MLHSGVRLTRYLSVQLNALPPTDFCLPLLAKPVGDQTLVVQNQREQPSGGFSATQCIPKLIVGW